MPHSRPSSQWRKFLIRRLDNLRGFSTGWGRSYGDLVNRAAQINTQMIANAATFPTPPVSMITLATQVNALRIYATSYKGNHGDKSHTLLVHQNAEDLVNSLAALGSYVATVARTTGTTIPNQMVILNSSGFPLVKIGSLNLASPYARHKVPGVPQNVRVLRTGVPGLYALRCKKVKGAKSYNFWSTNTGGPDILLATSTKSFWRNTDSIPQGSVLSIYVTANGTNGLISAPSQIATLVAY